MRKVEAEKMLGRRIPEEMVHKGEVAPLDLHSLRREAGAPLGRVLVFHHTKGGVGKTTIATNVSVQLSMRGWKVLLIDMDASGGATYSLGLSRDEDEPTMLDIFAGEVSYEDAVRRPFDDLPLFAIGSNGSFADVGAWLTTKRAGSDTYFSRFLRKIAGEGFDFIVVDSAPNFDVVHTNVHVAADHVLVPFIPEPAVIEEFGRLFAYMAEVRDAYGLDEPALHLVPNAVNASIGSHKATMERVRENDLPLPVDEEGGIYVPQDSRIKAAPEKGYVFVQGPRSRATRAFERLARFIEMEATDG